MEASSNAIRVNAVYPTFAVISWDVPTPNRGAAAAGGAATWRYSVEWNCSCLQNQPPFRGSGASLLAFAVIPLHHPGEVVYVRVVSKGTAPGGSTVGLTTLKTFFVAACNVSFPLFSPVALRSPLLHDCLLLAVNSAIAAASPPLGGGAEASVEGLYRLDSGLVVAAYRVRYEQRPAPLSTSSVLVLVATATDATGAQLTSESLWERLLTRDAACILCGTGYLGSRAALATYALLATLLSKGTAATAMSERIYCVAYGAPRCRLAEAPAAMTAAARLSGNIVFYSGLMRPSLGVDGAGGFCPSDYSAAGPCSGAGLSRNFSLVHTAVPHAAPSTDVTVNTALGVRVGPLMDDGARGEYSLYGEASTAAQQSEEELCEQFDCPRQLAVLEGFLRVPTAADDDDSSFCEDSRAPSISAISYEVEGDTSAVLRLYIGGRNLHYGPRITCLTVPGDEPLAMTVVSRSADQLVCQGSLIVNMGSACYAALAVGAAAPAVLGVSVMVVTDMGFADRGCAAEVLAAVGAELEVDRGVCGRVGATLPGGPIVRVPATVSELLFRASKRQQAADAWMVGSPHSLVHAALASLPFALFASAGNDPRAVDRNVATSRALRYLSQLGAVALVADHCRTVHRPQNSLVAFVERVTSKRLAQGGLQEMPVAVDALERNLRHLVLSGPSARADVAFLDVWNRRLFAALPDLDENRYRLKLHWLLALFSPADLSREQPLVSLELQLYVRVVEHLRAAKAAADAAESGPHRAGSRAVLDAAYGLSQDFVVTEAFSFDDFFRLTRALFLPTAALSSTREGLLAALMPEVAFLWATCAVTQLRRQYTSAAHHVVAVTGCRGSGCSTLATALAAVCAELATVQAGDGGRMPSILVKLVPEEALPFLNDLLSTGLATTVVIAAELADFGGLALSAITRSIHSSVVDTERQALHMVLTKTDERLSLPVVEGGAMPRAAQTEHLARAGLTAATAAAAASSPWKVVPVPVSLAPSLGSVRGALLEVRSPVREEELAAELLQQSIERLRDLVLCDLDRL